MKKFFGLLASISFLLLWGTMGASDNNLISTTHLWIQAGILVMIFAVSIMIFNKAE